jgi:hypothetical protein
LHLFTLSVAAFAAPLFIVLGAQAEFFVVRRSSALDVVVFVFLLTLGPPLLLGLLELVVGCLSARVRGGLHALWVALLGILICQGIFRLWWPLSLGLGVLAAVAYQRRPEVYAAVSRLSVLCLVLPLAFLFLTPVRGLLLGSGGGAMKGVEVASTTPVVVMLFDELPLSSLLGPKLEVDSHNFPNFRRFQQDSLWFRNAATVADDTMRAVPSILTGVRAPLNKPPLLSNYPVNLFTILGGSYKIAATENLTALAPMGQTQNLDMPLAERRRVLASDTAILYLHLVLPAAMAGSWLPPVDKGWSDFANEIGRPPREQSFLSFLDVLGPSRRPALYYCHTNLPHYPYSFLPDGHEYDSGGDEAVEGLDMKWMWTSPWMAILGYQRHLLQVKFCDHLLGLAIDRLKQLGLYDKALIVVLADHGSSYRFGAPFRPADPADMPGVGPVPIMVKLPGADHPRRIVDRPVTTIDVLPTILDVLKVDLRVQLEGHSLLDEQNSSTGRRVSADLMKTGKMVPYPDDLSLLREAVRYKCTVFGPALENLYRVGPATSMVGKPFEVRGDAPYRASLLWPSLLQDVHPERRVLPCRLRGSVDSGGKSLPLVVAINGVVAGSTWSEPGPGGMTFSLIVDPTFLKPGRNDVAMAVLEKDRSLRRVALLEDPAYTLKGDQLCDEQGRAIPRDENLEGEVLGMILEQSGFRIEGWAILHQGDQAVPPERLVFFQDGRFLLSAAPSANGTFRLSLPRLILLGEKKPRVFAVGESGARELRYQASYRKQARIH